jgi:hypothetical protein
VGGTAAAPYDRVSATRLLALGISWPLCLGGLAHAAVPARTSKLDARSTTALSVWAQRAKRAVAIGRKPSAHFIVAGEGTDTTGVTTGLAEGMKALGISSDSEPFRVSVRKVTGGGSPGLAAQRMHVALERTRGRVLVLQDFDQDVHGPARREMNQVLTHALGNKDAPLLIIEGRSAAAVESELRDDPALARGFGHGVELKLETRTSKPPHRKLLK